MRDEVPLYKRASVASADVYSTTALFILFGCLRLCQITASVVTLYEQDIFIYSLRVTTAAAAAAAAPR